MGIPEHWRLRKTRYGLAANSELLRNNPWPGFQHALSSEKIIRKVHGHLVMGEMELKTAVFAKFTHKGKTVLLPVVSEDKEKFEAVISGNKIDDVSLKNVVDYGQVVNGVRTFGFIGGGSKSGERPATTLKRELREELSELEREAGIDQELDRFLTNLVVGEFHTEEDLMVLQAVEKNRAYKFRALFSLVGTEIELGDGELAFLMALGAKEVGGVEAEEIRPYARVLLNNMG
jgi:hypothetical protein